jgi:hypothetical protein
MSALVILAYCLSGLLLIKRFLARLASGPLAMEIILQAPELALLCIAGFYLVGLVKLIGLALLTVTAVRVMALQR